MNRNPYSILSLKYPVICVLFFLALSGSASALTMTATPPSINISPGTNHPIQIFYRAYQIDAPAFSAVSNQGRFITADEFLLGTVNSTVSIQVVASQGSATESVVVPAAILRTALDRKQNRIFFLRTFNSVDFGSDTSTVQLQLVPASAGQFSIQQMELAFNKPAADNFSRPSSGGRITVSRNARGLTATALLAYHGAGTLQGRWKVDGQVLEVVTRQMTAGLRELAITSPVTPGFPTYATGIHRVEFEILNPEPGFNSPVLFYYVSDEPPGPPLGSLKLIAPLERQHIRLSPDHLPEFSWASSKPGVVYHFQLYGLESPAAIADVSRMDFTGKKPLVAALTPETSYRISIFDFDRIIAGMTYIWQVKAYDGQNGIANSRSRLIYFTPSSGETLPSNSPEDLPEKDENP